MVEVSFVGLDVVGENVNVGSATVCATVGLNRIIKRKRHARWTVKDVVIRKIPANSIMETKIAVFYRLLCT